MNAKEITVRLAQPEDVVYAGEIIKEMEASAIARGSGISKRTAASIIEKINAGKAIIALTRQKQWVGFSYIETWDQETLVSNSGLIVAPAYRKQGVASRIKKQVFALSRKKYPHAQVFSITSGLSIMKMNTNLGFQAVTYTEIAKESKFWDGCQSCVNYHILQQKNRKNCLCTAMLYTPVIN